MWAHINPSAGVFNWATVDAFMAGSTGSVCWTVYGTPTWAASPTDQAVKDSYYISGGGGAPVDPNSVAAYVTAVLQRYPTRIKWVEIWNEPAFVGPQTYNNAGLPTSTAFWWGTKVQLVALGNAIRNAAKAVNPNVIILSPGFVGDVASVNSDAFKWLGTVDPASGKRGIDVIDAFAYHTYGCGATGNNDIVNDPYAGAVAVRSMLGSFDFRGDMYITECGLDRMGNVAPNEFSVLSAADRYNRIASTLMAAAAAGVKAVFLYSYNSNWCGDLVNDTTGVIPALSYVHTQVAGKTISAFGGVNPGDSTIALTLTTGSATSATTFAANSLTLEGSTVLTLDGVAPLTLS